MITDLSSFIWSHVFGIVQTVWIVWEVRRAARTTNALANKPNNRI